jgi:hypothetical protein
MRGYFKMNFRETGSVFGLGLSGEEYGLFADYCEQLNEYSGLINC